MVRAFLASVAQLGDRAILQVLFKSLLLTLLVFAGLAAGIWAAARWLAEQWQSAADWSAEIAITGAIFGVLILGWLLFRGVAIAIIGVFGDEVVRAVEARHYPAALARARDVPIHRATLMSLASALRLILVNLAAVPAYLFLAITGIGAAMLFFLINAWLLGRDLGDMVAARHLPAREMREWRRTTRAPRLALGAIGTGLLLVPFVNLLAPVLVAAMATHLFHGGRKA